MSRDTPYTRTLRRALEAVGGKERLAELLGVSLADLALWIEGDAVPSISIFSRALDIVADGDVRAAPRKKRPPPKS